MVVVAVAAGRAAAAVATGVVREVGGVKGVVREAGGMVVDRVAGAGAVAVAGMVEARQVGVCHLLVPRPELHLAVAVLALPAVISSTATAPAGRSAASRTSVGYVWRC